MKRNLIRILCLLLCLAMTGCGSGAARPDDTASKSLWEDGYMASGKLYEVWFDEAATQNLDGFERWSLPLGNGYMGINVFGGTDNELITVTENSVFNGTYSSIGSAKVGPFGQERCDANAGGLSLLAKTHIEFGHENVTNYRRQLRLNDATAKVSYECDGVTYTREYFCSYPDKVTVMRLYASQPGALSFTLSPEAAYCYDYLQTEGDGMGKSGQVSVNGDTITITGLMNYYNLRYEAQYKVIPEGGKLLTNENGKGTITVAGADSAVILLAVGTNYKLDANTFLANEKEKLDPNEDPHEKVQGYLDAAAAKDYATLLSAHRADYCELFDRAQIDLGGIPSDTQPTDQLVQDYKKGSNDPYLEELVFQFGRFLLIQSSREGCLPANLQGIWNYGDSAAWTGGYWHNINVQMNYWPAFNTGLAELFQSYVDYNEAFRPAAQANADKYVAAIGAPTAAAAGTGENGWAVGTGCNPYKCAGVSANSHSGPGTGAFTSLLFWDYYDFTRDETILKEHTYPAVEGMAKFLSKTLKEYEDGKWLVYKSASPENNNGFDKENNKYIYYHTVGCAFDQQMVYANHLATLQAAEALGYTEKDYPILATIREQIEHLDPVNIGYSGQVKEYREENYYGEIGEKKHRHISQLVGVYPASVINGTTPAWLEAAGVSLRERGTCGVAWGKAHRLLCWARIQNADEAYGQIQGLLKENTSHNLWGNYNTNPNNDPFQIESNFGYTAGVAEMLVQSHAGYIEFLPVLPEAWQSGSFTGLTTRGNFAVDAVWENGQAVSFTVHARSGGSCGLYYPGIENATVLDAAGDEVVFQIVENNLITFDSVKGETYTVKNLPTHTDIDAPESVTVSVEGDKAVVRWREGQAASYNLYVAEEDEPDYTLLQADVHGGSYTVKVDDYAGKRVTFRVTAVAEDGTESDGAITVLVP